ncbi:hypothetical protein ACFYVR_20345 [Rhodococcus sp. NPDC003318]|uniref:hypothetical protein n=1 Tax=Rhodococcus sp. NPDC003318 TaxID=3364503 RepID=UPI0036B80767
MTTAADREIVDDTLGTLVRGQLELSDGNLVDNGYFDLTCELGGRRVTVMVTTADPDEARRLLPGVRRVVEDVEALRQRATDEVVRRFSEDTPTDEELADARHDLVLDTIEARSGGDVVLHLTDTCGSHFPDGYWPAVRLAPDGSITDVTVES